MATVHPQPIDQRIRGLHQRQEFLVTNPQWISPDVSGTTGLLVEEIGEDAHHAVIHGPARLHGAEAEIGDLRAGASLIL
ncbi:MAG TPA: hypothetical protein VLM40_13070, partial [Gemmata sp.]|nr:hypothetical protein [Gemmata sp.]